MVKKILFSLIILSLTVQTSLAQFVAPEYWDSDGSTYVQTNPSGMDIGTTGTPVGDIYGGTLHISGITMAGNIDVDGYINLVTGNDYQINNASVLNATTLGGAVLASSLTSLGTIASLVATTADINAGTFDGTVGGTTPDDGSFSTLSSTGVFTASEAIDITIADTVNNVGLTVTQNDTTNNPITALFTNAGTNAVVDIGTIAGVLSVPLRVKSNATNHAIYLEENSGAEDWQIGVQSDGTLAFFNSAAAIPNVRFHDDGTVFIENTLDVSIADTANGVGLTVIQNDVTNNPNAATITNAGTGDSLNIDHNISNTTSSTKYGLNIDYDRVGTVADAGTDINYGIYVTPTVTGATSSTVSNYGVYSVATGDTGGTSTAIGGYFEATGADTNHAIYAKGDLVTVGTTNDGSTDIFVGNDSDDAEVFSIDTDGNMSIAGSYNTSFPIDLGDDAGFQTLFDKDLTSASAAGFEESLMMAIDHENYITLYAENDGSGNLQNESIKTLKRFQYKQGTDIASANDITIGNNGNLFDITGTTQINRISPTGWQAGAGFKLQFDGVVTIKDAQATGGGYNTILCDNSTDIVTATGTIVEFLYDGTAFKAWIIFSE